MLVLTCAILGAVLAALCWAAVRLADKAADLFDGEE
jgi:hypothetical protein